MTAEPAKPAIVFSIPFFRSLRDLIRALAEVGRDPETQALPAVAGALILTGTVFYWLTEGWTVVQAFYFSVITLTTVGYGDLTPTTAGTQIFTVVYLLTGIGVLLALLTSIAQAYIKQKAEAPSTRERLKTHRHDGDAD
jgi:Ion channel.